MLLFGATFISASPAAARPPASPAVRADTVKGCYVNGSGTIYRTHAPNAPSGCKQATHVPMSWPDGMGDDYPRYLLAGGVRDNSDGFAVSGSPGHGSIPATGAGVRLMWYSARAAFRAGRVLGDNWDKDKVGAYSVAMGYNTTASGTASTAIGFGATASASDATALGIHSNASGMSSTAIGDRTKASGQSATALGDRTTASGSSATAIGLATVASGWASTAMGSYASTNGKTGAFVYGDKSSETLVAAQANNQFVARAQRFWLGNSNNVTATSGRFIETSTGAYLSTGGTWTNSSDVARKENFEKVDGDDVLEKLAALAIRSWNYKDDERTVRHIGPTAQDFHAAFRLGDTNKAIATVDADGVSLAAIQALEKHSRMQAREIAALKQENARLRERMERQERQSAETAAALEALRRSIANRETGRR